MMFPLFRLFAESVDRKEERHLWSGIDTEAQHKEQSSIHGHTISGAEERGQSAAFLDHQRVQHAVAAVGSGASWKGEWRPDSVCD